MLLERLRVIPLLIFVAMLAFSVRLADVVVKGFPDLSGAAYAEDAKPAETAKTPSQEGLDAPADKPADKETAAADTKTDEKPAAKEGDDKTAAKDDKTAVPAATETDKEAGAVSPTEWKDASDSDLDVDDVKIEMFKDLAKRRDELDKREASLVTKEALLKATEQELDRKYQELDKLRGELKKLLGDQQGQEDARITSLVKVYEGMKPKDAARIFDTLDLDVLISVMSKMSERKLSPVLAEMNPERAKTVTTMLAEQKQLPEIPAEAAAGN